MNKSLTTEPDSLPLVVLIEDDPDHAELMRRSLVKADIDIDLLHLNDGKKALDYFLSINEETALPNLILLDLSLPKLDGWQVLVRLKKSACAAVPVVVLTSSSNPDDIARATQMHANSYIAKPARLQGYIDLAQALCSYWLGWNKLAPGILK
ncbi:MAG: response regulator [Immundisolibacteraceae bacterium]|nr:response regulator [Immundisolibacteraceae bacterium]